MKVRRFKLRNGMLVKEFKRANTCLNADGYQDDYEILAGGDEDYPDGSWLCLSIMDSSGIPKGASHGEEFDIVEEIEVEGE